ncbi:MULTISPECIES: thiamine diphosphokinase [Lactobacillus]|uniref:Thiamine diphosphokinase n=1 Tax=Lactobacillus xujianguonis TaxID=2495899 RepID=A0A437SXI6_9LACO|nr:MULTISPECIES: thiamine diphosphokinase [Lactobacillus]RVU71644.1 thiamine diphosphokinase [Lactobacillus xujianguonis]RVU77705.1 thiamine diphosphokinase [Lactobacillus xujianguonis]
MKAYALLGGPTDLWPEDIKKRFLKAKYAHDLVVGVDRGSLYLEELGIVPDLAVGDFDSLKPKDLSRIESNVPDIRYSNPIKDWTDSELMLQTVFDDYHVTQLTILGATGGRIDHFLINLLMLLNQAIRQFAERVTILDQQNKILFFNPGQHSLQQDLTYPYIGFAGLTGVKNFSIKHARYELDNFSANYPRVFSSNEFLPHQPEFEISFDEGMIAAIYSKDINRFHNL